MTTAPAPTCVVTWRGAQSEALLADARYLDIEGAFRSGKTTIGLWKVLNAALDHPGMRWLICRWTDDATFSLLRPVWRAICEQAGVRVTWHPDESYDALDNGSLVYIRGLKASEETNRYGKFRGLTLAGVYWDQAEEGPHDVYQELSGRLSQQGMPHQLVITPNPPAEDHWIAREFPESNHLIGRQYLRLSVYDNAHNLDAATIAGLEQTYPPGHAKHGPAILGTRGLNVTGQPVYAGAFRRDLHVRPLTMNSRAPLLEVLDFGKHHPCVLWSQFDPWGGWQWLGGILGQDLGLGEFCELLQTYRAQWFPGALAVEQACDPAGTHDNSHGTVTAIETLRQHGIFPRWVENSNAPVVRRGCIERMTDYMRTRTAQGERFGVDAHRWLVLSATERRETPFAAQALEAGYVWDERTRTTAGGKSVVVPRKDGWFEHVMNCAEYTELNFGRGQQTEAQLERHAASMARAAVRRAQRDRDPYDLRHAWAPRHARGGY